MESTGVFWKPIVNLLEAEDIEFLVVNAQHMKALPGRKTDVKDAEWICDLLRHGLLKPVTFRIETSVNCGSWFAIAAV
jgi:transposase